MIILENPAYCVFTKPWFSTSTLKDQLPTDILNSLQLQSAAEDGELHVCNLGMPTIKVKVDYSQWKSTGPHHKKLGGTSISFVGGFCINYQ